MLPIQVDGSNPAREVALYSFFPKEVVAHPGDTLRFKVSSVGEPHTVAFGTLVDSALAAVEKANLRTAENVFLNEPPEMSVIPSIFASTPDYKPENQSAGQPCFLDEGVPPLGDPCPKRAQPSFDGTQAYYNSGYLEGGATWDVPLSGTIKPGTYRYMNVIYRGLMTGSITIVGKGVPRPAPEEVASNGQEELQRALGSIADDLSAAKKVDAAKAVAGVMTSSPTAVGMVFEPRQATISVGESVTWNLYLCHTITFNPPSDAFGDLKRMPDGSVRLNPVAYTPVQAADPPAFSGTLATRWDGTGYFNSGGLCAVAPGQLAYTVTFSRPGTYQVVCLFHPAMVGRITVA